MVDLYEDGSSKLDGNSLVIPRMDSRGATANITVALEYGNVCRCLRLGAILGKMVGSG